VCGHVCEMYRFSLCFCEFSIRFWNRSKSELFFVVDFNIKCFENMFFYLQQNKKNKGLQDSIQLCFVFNTELSFELILKMCLSLNEI